MQQLTTISDTLEPWLGKLPAAPLLGYRGCFLRCAAAEEWFAYGGAVTLQAGSLQQSRSDDDHIFEKRLLASARAMLSSGVP